MCANVYPYSESKRDSMCSLISVNSGMSLDFFTTPESVLDNLDFDVDDVSTDLASSEASPMKDKLMSLDFDEEGDMPSRKRRASHFQEPNFVTTNFMANLGDSSSSLFGDDANYLPSTLEAEIYRLESYTSNGGRDIPKMVERQRSQSAERRRIQSELLARLECLDGIQLPEAPEPLDTTDIVIENDDQVGPEQQEPKLGIYTEKQRIERLNAYREKRKQRVYGRVRYVLRQRVSENRPRVKGRFVKQTSEPTATPDSIRGSSATSSPASTGIPDTPVRRVEFRVEPEESPVPKRGRSAWDMFKNLSLSFSPIRTGAKSVKEKRPSLPATFSERLLLARRKSTTAASTASGKARRKLSRDEFFDEEEIKQPQEPDRKRATSMKQWSH